MNTLVKVVVTILSIAVLMSVIAVGVVLAQETATPPATTVSLPWGDWVLAGIGVLQPTVTLLLTGVATYVVGKFMPPWMRAFAGDAAQRRVNQVLEKAVLSAIAQTKGAVAGKRLDVPLGTAVLARAAQYAIDQAPELIKHAAKDEVDNLLKMLMARMESLGVAPADYDIATARGGTKGGFDFDRTIRQGLGGK